MPFALTGAVAAVSLLGVAEPAHATGGGAGTATATTAAVGLDVKLLNGSVDVPVDVTLNKITAPGFRSGAALTAVVSGAEGGKPVDLLLAKIGSTEAKVDAHGARASVELTDARLHLPGLPLTELLGAHLVSAEADCPVDGAPTAKSELLGQIKVLGVGVNLSTAGPSKVNVPGVGEVDLWLSKRTTTSTTAAATALELEVTVNPLNLNVAAVTGKITLADVSCTKGDGSWSGSGGSSGGPLPSGSPSQVGAGDSGGSGGTGGGNDTGGTGGSGGSSAQPSASVSASTPATNGGTGSTGGSGSSHLAMTGSSSATPVIAGGALILVGAGAAAVMLTRRRRRG